MMKLLLGIALVLLITVNATGSCSVNCPGCSYWVIWNQEVSGNGGAACSNFTRTTPSNFTKVTGLSTPTDVVRRQLSHYVHSSNSSCKVFCPPRSYLVAIGSSPVLYYCERDPAYYSSAFKQYCIPQFEAHSGDNTYCNSISQGVLENNSGKCSLSVLLIYSEYEAAIDAETTDCCFRNYNDGENYNGGLTDDIKDVNSMNLGYYNIHNVW